MPVSSNQQFETIVGRIADIGLDAHKNALYVHAQLNMLDAKKSIKQLPPLSGQKAQSAIVISAGPSVHRRKSLQRIRSSEYQGTLIAVDGAYIACLKVGIIPDYVLTLDPHPTRIVRWFGDPDFEHHAQHDDYFSRQDLDVEFRKNTIEQNKLHIKLVNEFGHLTKAIVASSAPRNVVTRLKEAHFDSYWWNPLVDDPQKSPSITRQLYDLNKMPCMNTGGTVGTASWVFAHSILKMPEIALIGMDLGYYADLPKEKTQTYYELQKHMSEGDSMDAYFVPYEFPLTKEKFYIDPTYFWYRQNFLELFSKTKSLTFNCTEGGTLFAENLACITLESFLSRHTQGEKNG